MRNILLTAAEVLPTVQEFPGMEELTAAMERLFKAARDDEGVGYDDEELTTAVEELEALVRSIEETIDPDEEGAQMNLVVLVALARLMRDEAYAFADLPDNLQAQAEASAYIEQGSRVARMLPEGFSDLVNAMMQVFSLCTEEEFGKRQFRWALRNYNTVCEAGNFTCNHFGMATWVAAYELIAQLDDATLQPVLDWLARFKETAHAEA